MDRENITKNMTHPSVIANGVQFKIQEKIKEDSEYIVKDRNFKPTITFPLKIVSSGYYVPKKVITNNFYAEKFNLDETWIENITGIKERRFAEDTEECSDLAVKAINSMMKKTSISIDDIDLIIFSSMGGDYSSPPTACIIQNKIKAYNAKVFDIIGSCTSFVQSLQVASLYLNSGLAKNIILVSSDIPSRGSNPQDKSTRILFGDGAGCILLNPDTSNTYGIISQDFGTDGRYWDVATILGGGTTYPVPNDEIGDKIWFRMDGKKLYKVAIEKMEPAINRVLTKSGLKIDDIKLIIPHQANYRIIQTLLKKMNAKEEKMYLTIEKYGNTATSSMLISLAEAFQLGKISKGEYLLLAGFGAGFNWGIVLLKY